MADTFSAFHRVLSFAGISIFKETNWNSKFWFTVQIFNFIIGLLCFLFTSGFVISSSSDLLLFIQGACIWTTGVIMTITLGICLVFRIQFRDFLTEMAFRDAALDIPIVDYIFNVNNGKKMMQLKKLVVESQKDLLNYTSLLLKIYVTGVWLCATLYLCSPIYSMLVSEDKSLRLLAFDMWFPWSLADIKVYTLSFIFHAYAGYLCCVAYPGLQSTIILLVGQIIRQLRILNFILQHLNELVLEVNQRKDEKWQKSCTTVLSQCVEHYVKIKRFSNRLNVICRPFYLALILVAIILVCMCSVKIAISDKLSPDTIKYYVHEICFIFVVLMFCLLGQQVDDECASLELAVTEKWYIFNRAHKQNVRIFKMALSQRMPIYIFGTITLSLPTFTWFIKTGMSFFTLVMSVLEEQ
ncbi:olfactory receptor-like [Bombyx mori]|uniref:Odorant receptor n=1 Tax=Bombyx mori TaxID=7091 RepID=C7S851_BOMMO|nr:olfactory receptor-like [Bombyx mori]ACH69152.1 olfactory receptor 49 [Bombyx mori]